MNRQGRGRVSPEEGRRKEGGQTATERDRVTDKTIKGEGRNARRGGGREKKSHRGQRTSFGAEHSLHVRTYVGYVTNVPTYLRTDVSTYRSQRTTIQSTLLSLPRRPRSTGCFSTPGNHRGLPGMMSEVAIPSPHDCRCGRTVKSILHLSVKGTASSLAAIGCPDCSSRT